MVFVLVSNRFKDRLKEKLIITEDTKIEDMKNVGKFTKKIFAFFSKQKNLLGNLISIMMENRIKNKNSVLRKYEGIRPLLNNPQQAVFNPLAKDQSYISYTILEKIDTTVESQLKVLFYLLFFKFNTGAIFPVNPFLALTDESKFNEAITMFDSWLNNKVIGFLFKSKLEELKNLTIEMGALMKNILAIVNWTDGHFGQFGKNSSGTLVAFDVDGPFANSSKYQEVKTIIRESRLYNF